MKLVIIESPNKRETLKKYLGDGYEVMSTKGHIRDLPTKSFAVDIENNFEPHYEIMSDKTSLVKELKQAAKKSEQVFIASDPDREGEAIAWHIAYILDIPQDEKCRITFNEISKTAVQKALGEPRNINQNLVDAQQARRILDRLVGYKVSPIICKKIKSGLSAGRVQSVALKLIVDREREIINFKPEEYWNVSVDLNKQNDSIIFKALATLYKGKKIKFKNSEEVENACKNIENAEYKITKIKKSTTSSHAPAPFTTSTMQQEAQNKAGMSTAVTTKTAQSLYEGVDIAGEGKTALITYIRTDSTRISNDAMQMAKEYIANIYGSNFIPSKQNIYSAKKDAQDAHEAIRPISLERKPELLKSSLRPEQYKLYKLIYERFLASQMANAEYDNVTVDIQANDITFRVTGKTLTFAGWTSAYKQVEEKNEDSDEVDKLPNMQEGEILHFNSIKKEQKFTKPPARYTESSLIKAMDENGIGRPATYAPTISVLANRNYTQKEGKYLLPTEIGLNVTDFLQKYFNSVFNIDFTADMETTLDAVAENNKDWHKVIEKFWNFLHPLLNTAYGGETMKIAPQESDEICEKCGAKMLIRDGKYGKFLGCSNYPNCKNIKSLEKTEYSGTCPNCHKRMVVRKSAKGKIYYSCEDYTNCKFMSWDIPTGNKCPKCNSPIVEKTIKGITQIKCSNKECDYIEQDS